MIKFEVDTLGNPKGPIEGNVECWLGSFEYCVKDAKPGVKLFTSYNKRLKQFGSKPIGHKPSGKKSKTPREVPPTQKLLATYCALAGVERGERINNMWARKSFADTTLGVLQMPAQTVMPITGHKSEQTLRQYYHSYLSKWHASDRNAVQFYTKFQKSGTPT